MGGEWRPRGCWTRTSTGRAKPPRVVEDYCRFVLDDRFLTGEVKELRHALAAASSVAYRRPGSWRRATRLGDVGTSVTAGGEYDRASPAEVARSISSGLQESLRSLEEFGKLFGPDLGREVEIAALPGLHPRTGRSSAGGVGARAARTAQALRAADRRGLHRPRWTGPSRGPRPAGPDVIQLREKGSPTGNCSSGHEMCGDGPGSRAFSSS